MKPFNQYTLNLGDFLDLLAKEGGQLRVDLREKIVCLHLQLGDMSIKQAVSSNDIRYAFNHALTDAMVVMVNELNRTKHTGETS